MMTNEELIALLKSVGEKYIAIKNEVNKYHYEYVSSRGEKVDVTAGIENGHLQFFFDIGEGRYVENYSYSVVEKNYAPKSEHVKKFIDETRELNERVIAICNELSDALKRFNNEYQCKKFIIHQGCDTGKYYVSCIDPEVRELSELLKVDFYHIREVDEMQELANKYLEKVNLYKGGWIPDYLMLSVLTTDEKLTLKDLKEKGMAEIVEEKDEYAIILTHDVYLLLKRIDDEIKRKREEEAVRKILENIGDRETAKRLVESYKELKKQIDEFKIPHEEILLKYNPDTGKLSIKFHDYENNKEFVRKYFTWNPTEKVWTIKPSMKGEFTELYTSAKNKEKERDEISSALLRIEQELRNKYVFSITTHSHDTGDERGMYVELLRRAWPEVAEVLASGKKIHINEKYGWAEWFSSYYGY